MKPGSYTFTVPKWLNSTQITNLEQYLHRSKPNVRVVMINSPYASGTKTSPARKYKRLYLTPNPSPDTRTSSEERGVHTGKGASERRLFFPDGGLKPPVREGSD